MDQWTAQERLMSPHGIAFRRRRGFHRLGVAIAAATMATGLAFVGAAVTRLEPVRLCFRYLTPRKCIAGLRIFIAYSETLGSFMARR